MHVLGIDEAGRGPVIGPMVIAGVIIDQKDGYKLRSMGIRDSKKVDPQKREVLFKEIKKVAKEIKHIVIYPDEIDSMRDIMNLNEIEAFKVSDLIEQFETPCRHAYIDAPDVVASNFAVRISKYLTRQTELNLFTEHKADDNYPSVSAASIIAKVIRDREVRKLEKKHGIIGTGYPHDARTISFLENWIQENREWPKFVRKTWDTAKVIEDRILQKNLKDYF